MLIEMFDPEVEDSLPPNSEYFRLQRREEKLNAWAFGGRNFGERFTDRYGKSPAGILKGFALRDKFIDRLNQITETREAIYRTAEEAIEQQRKEELMANLSHPSQEVKEIEYLVATGRMPSSYLLDMQETFPEERLAAVPEVLRTTLAENQFYSFTGALGSDQARIAVVDYYFNGNQDATMDRTLIAPLGRSAPFSAPQIVRLLARERRNFLLAYRRGKL